MCFSASASFVAAVFTGSAGIAAATRTHTRTEIPLATVPLFFAIQQAVEGLLWLSLPEGFEGPVPSLLTLVFLVFAKVIWPILIPLAVVLIEPQSVRQRLITWCCAAGVLAGAFFVWSLFANPHMAWIEGGHIAYRPEPYLPLVVGVMYVAATCVAPLLSSHAAVRVLGMIVTAGSAVTYLLYWEAYTSVWCFFSAAGSSVIVFHFEKARQRRLAFRPSA